MADGRKWRRRTGRVLGVFLLLILAGIIYILIVSKTNPPKIADQSSLNWQRTENSRAFTV